MRDQGVAATTLLAGVREPRTGRGGCEKGGRGGGAHAGGVHGKCTEARGVAGSQVRPAGASSCIEARGLPGSHLGDELDALVHLGLAGGHHDLAEGVAVERPRHAVLRGPHRRLPPPRSLLSALALGRDMLEGITTKIGFECHCEQCPTSPAHRGENPRHNTEGTLRPATPITLSVCLRHPTIPHPPTHACHDIQRQPAAPNDPTSKCQSVSANQPQPAAPATRQPPGATTQVYQCLPLPRPSASHGCHVPLHRAPESCPQLLHLEAESAYHPSSRDFPSAHACKQARRRIASTRGWAHRNRDTAPDRGPERM